MCGRRGQDTVGGGGNGGRHIMIGVKDRCPHQYLLPVVHRGILVSLGRPKTRWKTVIPG